MSPKSAIVVPSTPVTITAANAAHPFCGVAVLQDAKSTDFASSTENLPSSATLFVHWACEYGPLPVSLRKSGGGKFPAVGSSFSDTGSARSLAAERRDPVPAAVGSLMQALTRNGSATNAGGSRVNRIAMRASSSGITTRVPEKQTPSHQFGSSAIAGVAFVTGGAASDSEIPRGASFGKNAPCLTPRYRSSSSVTGPSLTSSTSIIAPNSPVSTGILPPDFPRSSATNFSYSGIARFGGAAPMKLGRRPLLASP